MTAALIDPALRRRAVRHLVRADAALAGVIAAAGEFDLKLQRRRFESLARAIIAQQISGVAAKSIWKRLQVLVRPRRITAESLALQPDQALRAVGISPQKLGYLRDLQAHVTSRSVRIDQLHRYADGDVIDELVRIRGIGVWTAQMFLIFALGRPDVLPWQDLGIRSAMKKLYGLADLPDRAQCEEIAAPWRPYASVASWYLWRSVD